MNEDKDWVYIGFLFLWVFVIGLIFGELMGIVSPIDKNKGMAMILFPLFILFLLIYLSNFSKECRLKVIRVKK